MMSCPEMLIRTRLVEEDSENTIKKKYNKEEETSFCKKVNLSLAFHIKN